MSKVLASLLLVLGLAGCDSSFISGFLGSDSGTYYVGVLYGPGPDGGVATFRQAFPSKAECEKTSKDVLARFDGSNLGIDMSKFKFVCFDTGIKVPKAK